jgi:hypothetical protein
LRAGISYLFAASLTIVTFRALGNGPLDFNETRLGFMLLGRGNPCTLVIRLTRIR